MSEEQLSFPERDDDLDDDYYNPRARKTYFAKGHLPEPGVAMGHAVGHDHPDSSFEAEFQSRGSTARQRDYVLRWLYTVGDFGSTVSECKESRSWLFKGSPNEASIPFGWARAGGWARHVRSTEPRSRLARETVDSKGIVRRPTVTGAPACVHVLTNQGRAEYERRYLNPNGETS